MLWNRDPRDVRIVALIGQVHMQGAKGFQNEAVFGNSWGLIPEARCQMVPLLGHCQSVHLVSRNKPQKTSPHVCSKTKLCTSYSDEPLTSRVLVRYLRSNGCRIIRYACHLRSSYAASYILPPCRSGARVWRLRGAQLTLKS